MFRSVSLENNNFELLNENIFVTRKFDVTLSFAHISSNKSYEVKKLNELEKESQDTEEKT